MIPSVLGFCLPQIYGVKEKIIKHEKKIDDYSDEEMEAMIAEEQGRLNDDVKQGILTTLLVAAGIDILLL